jgi:hypothetical protein
MSIQQPLVVAVLSMSTSYPRSFATWIASLAALTKGEDERGVAPVGSTVPTVSRTIPSHCSGMIVAAAKGC